MTDKYKALDAEVLKHAVNENGIGTKSAFDAAIRARIADKVAEKYAD